MTDEENTAPSDLSDLGDSLELTKKIEANLAAIKKIAPRLGATLAGRKNSSLIRIEELEDGSQNLMFSEHRYYKKSAQETVDEHLDDMGKFFFTVHPVGLDDGKAAAGKHLMDRFKYDLGKLGKSAKAAPAGETNYDNTLLLMLGLGLGHQIVPVVQRCRPVCVVIIEQSIDYWALSLRNLDWVAIIDELQDMDCELKIIAEPSVSPAAQIDQCLGMVTFGGSFGFFGSVTSYLHQDNAINSRLLDAISERQNLFFTTNGYVEDERIMASNGMNNLSGPNRHVMVKTDRYVKRCPALIVASGPSIEPNYDLIKRLAPHCVVFSCGTGLGGLLKNGIRPDFHSDLENGEQVPMHHAHLAKRFGLEGVSLVGSMTLRPECATYFDKSFLHHRTGPSVYRLTRDVTSGISFCEPSVANTALSQAAAFGFETAYLFGVDLGSRKPGTHHAPSVVFYEEDELIGKVRRKKQVEESQFKYNNKVRANFGGISFSNILFELFASNLTILCVNNPELKVFNASDGRYIVGTIPCDPDTIELGDDSPKGLELARKTKALDLRDIEEMFAPSESIASHIDAWWASFKRANDNIFSGMLVTVGKHWSPKPGEIKELTKAVSRIVTHDSTQIPEEDRFLIISWRGTIISMLNSLSILVRERVFDADNDSDVKLWGKVRDSFIAGITEAHKILDAIQSDRQGGSQSGSQKGRQKGRQKGGAKKPASKV